MVRMLPTILKNLGSRPVTRDYPRQNPGPWRGYRGRLVLFMERCILCTACEKRCPAGAIEIKREEGIFKYDPYSCVVCGACVEACPKRCLEIKSEWLKPAGEMRTEVFTIEPSRPRQGQ